MKSSNSILKYILPYCIKQPLDETVIFLNRLYKPIGFNNEYSNWVTYEDYPIHFSPTIPWSKLQQTVPSPHGNSEGDSLFLYMDHTHPLDSDRNWQAYCNKLRDLTKLLKISKRENK